MAVVVLQFLSSLLFPYVAFFTASSSLEVAAVAYTAVGALALALLGSGLGWSRSAIGLLCGIALVIALANTAAVISYDHGDMYRLLFALIVGPLSIGTLLLTRKSPLTMGAAALCATIAAGPITVSLFKIADRRLFSSTSYEPLLPGHAIALALIAIGLLISASRRTADYQEQSSGRGFKTPHALFLLLAAPCFIGAFDIVILAFEPSEWIMLVTLTAQATVIGVMMLWVFRMLYAERSTARIFSRVADLMPIALVDSQGKIIYWSRGCETLYGWSAREVIGKVKSVLLNSREPANDYTRRGAEGSSEYQLIESHKDGSTIHILERRLVTDEKEAGSVTVLSMTDIGKRVAIEQALRDSDERLALAAEAHAIGIFEWRVGDNNVQWISDTETQLGLPPGTLSDFHRWARLVLPEDLETIRKRLEATVWAKAERFSFFYRMRLPSGEVRAIEGSARCFYDEQGMLIRTIGVNIDVTARVDREAQLAAREAQLRSILDTVPSAMIVVDEDGVILTFSKAAERMFGYSAAVAIGRRIQMLMEDFRIDIDQENPVRIGEAGDRRPGGAQHLLSALHADGRKIPVELRLGEARYNNTRVFTAFVQDISERLESEERLDTLRSELNHVGRLNAMGELAAGLAHEINQPLSAIANYMAIAEIMLDDDRVNHAKLRAQLAAVRQQSLRAGQIIRRMRDFASKHETDSRVESVHSVIEEATSLVLTGYDRLGIDIRYQLSDDALYMFGDRIQVQQVLVNLLRNSMDALAAVPREDRKIVIWSRTLNDDMLELSVSDTGPGLSSDILEQIYMPFKTTKGEGGMGIGLSICRRIVEAHGGTLSGENMPEGGARFRFTLPRVNKQEVSA